MRGKGSAKTSALRGFYKFLRELADFGKGALPDLATVVGSWIRGLLECVMQNPLPDHKIGSNLQALLLLGFMTGNLPYPFGLLVLSAFIAARVFYKS